MGVGAPKGTGLHRYNFVLYEQPNGKITVDEVRANNASTDGRFHFSLRKFLKKYGFSDEPIAGNMFQAQYDSSVDELYKKLNMQF